jgi:hypothetical protein
MKALVNKYNEKVLAENIDANLDQIISVEIQNCIGSDPRRIYNAKQYEKGLHNVDIEFLNETPDDDRAILTGAIKNVYNSLMEWYDDDEDFCLEQIKGALV